MASFEDTSQSHPLLDDLESNIDQEKYTNQDNDNKSPPTRSKSRMWHILALCLTSFTLVVIIARVAICMRSSPTRESTTPSIRCQNPSIRREWRMLSDNEKREYLDAVVCLTKTPSVVGRNQTLFDDFPWIHTKVGKSAHHSAQFLVWHRYFLHIYETQLRDVCHYSGSLVFFDWQLNIYDLPQAPIWDPDFGFGGDGNITGPRTVNAARCVTDGPFANLQVLYYAEKEEKHCLSRGFQPPEDMERYYSERVSEEAISELMSIQRYEDFNLGMEHGAHLAMPHAVLGDFLVDTAPNDPVFFLHHAQLDRLWWKWQKSRPGRSIEYNGASARVSDKEASLRDRLDMGVLAPGAMVAEVIDTQAGLLCYEYAY